MQNSTKNIWVKLAAYERPYLTKGAMVRFRTLDNAGNGYKYAIATQIDAYRNLGFVGMDGGTWGYGRCMVPDEAMFEGKRSTISRDWLLKNFIYIASPQDIDDIWVCSDALMVLYAYEELSGTGFNSNQV